MQTTTAAQATPRPLIFTRHLIGMGIVALANPLIYYDRQPIGMWFITYLGPIVLALAAYGLYAVFLTERAKRGWPNSFFMLSWVILGLFILGQWSDYNSIRTQKPAAQAAARPVTPQNSPASLAPFYGKLDEPSSRQPGQIDEILKDAPAHQPQQQKRTFTYEEAYGTNR
ncbi:hypothetical protein [Comamonas testosteroni]|uniref:hypothetical protein n=1 Tax=Comamonas testosteroni TaxID=285 RepID=UPI0028EF004B|nr:hypothetical protein [Comamonas testosteroni]